MQLALFLIALGFGFKIFGEASQNPKKSIKQLGRTIGASVMIVSALASLLFLGTAAKCMKMGCSPFENLGKGFGDMKKMCPFTGKEIPGSQPTTSK